MVEKMMENLVRVTHAAIIEGREPSDSIQSFLLEQRNTPHISTGRLPPELLLGRDTKTLVPTLYRCAWKDDVDSHVRKKDKEQKLKYKEYTDKRRRAMVVKVESGDTVMVKEEKTNTQPSWDP